MDSVKDYAIVMLDTKGRILVWNDGAARLNGYDADEAIGRPITVLYPDAETGAALLEKELRDARTLGRYEGDGTRRRKDGSLWHAHVTLTPVLDSFGALQGFAKVMRRMGPA